MTDPQQPDLFAVGRRPTKRSHKRRYVFEALCEVHGLNPRMPGTIGGGMIQRWEKELRDRHDIPDEPESIPLILKMADAYKVHPNYGAAKPTPMPLTAKALVDAWPRLTQTKPPMRPYDLTEKQQAERDRVSADEKKAVRRNKIQRQIAKHIIEEHGGEKAEAVQLAYVASRGTLSAIQYPFHLCIGRIAEALAPGEIAKRLDEMRQSWLRRHHETAEAILNEREQTEVVAAWEALRADNRRRIPRKHTMEMYYEEMAEILAPGELARRMED